jgi:CheY-like chemotaxis protein
VPPKPRLLVATAEPGYAVLRELFADEAETVFAFTLREAAERLAVGDIDLVLCTIHFDESRMFDLLRHARSAAPSVPVVCCRLFDTRLTGSLLDAMIIAVEGLGGVFIDRRELQRRHGDTSGDAEFRKLVLAHVPSR